MQTFTGWQYLLIDVANQFGLDKLPFEERVQWAEDNLNQLEQLAEDHGVWKARPLYLKAVQAIRKAQQGIPTGHKMGLDAVCSGMQVMSALTGCEAGAYATGLINPDVPKDAYTEVTDAMRELLGQHIDVPRSAAKQATMTTLYGSEKEPQNLFGEGSKELNAFYKALFQVAPGASELLQDLLDSWQPFTLSHDWVLPDNYHAHVKVMEDVEKRIEIDELDHATFTHYYKENLGSKKGLSNVANAIHSIDAYVLRSLVRRCNYDLEMVEWASSYIQMILLERNLDAPQESNLGCHPSFIRLQQRYEATQMTDIRILNYCWPGEIAAMSTPHLGALSRIVNQMLEHAPFEIVCIHDEFQCHPNNMNHLRSHYRELLAELAESTVLDDILSQLHGVPGTYPKKSTGLAEKIRQSNYGLC